jgi:hypothetical protein
MSKPIADVVKEAFTAANLLDTDYDVVIVKISEDHDTTTHSATVHSFQRPNKKMVIEFQKDALNFVIDVFASYNTLLVGKQFQRFFNVCCKYEYISFD